MNSADRHPARGYLALDFPAAFVIEVEDPTGRWLEHGRFSAEHFVRETDGSYTCAGHGGSPVFLRCVAKRGERLECIDGAGQPHTYRLRALPT